MIVSNLNTHIILEDGTGIRGVSIGAEDSTVSEVVFNTATTGYQEVITDPSYASQSVVFTYPHIGNTGINNEDNQSENVYLDSIIVKNFCDYGSSHRMTTNLKEFLLKHSVIVISDVDTRMLTRHIRSNGSMLGYISSSPISINEGLEKIKQYKNSEINILTSVSTKKIHNYKPSVSYYKNKFQKKLKKKVVVFDFGVKKAILDNLSARFTDVILVPYDTNSNKILSLNPDAIILSNGPGDPRYMTKQIDEIKRLIVSNIPMLGICLGHQLLALACDGKIDKLKFGHHGLNHPVYYVKDKLVSISSQNHNYYVSEIPDFLEITSYSLFDRTIQALRHKKLPIITFQGHPEGAPGPLDCNFYFDQLVTLLD